MTILVCDLTGWSRAVERFGVDAKRRVEDRYVAACARVVERHDGQVQGLDGGAAGCVFGMAGAGEDPAPRACRSALDLVGAIGDLLDDLEPPHDIPLGLGVGVRSGDAARDAVDDATRLAQAAGLGKVLVDSATRARAANALVTEPVNPVPLAGVREPIEAFLLLGLAVAPEPSEGWSAPSGLDLTVADPLLGARDVEVDELLVAGQ